MQADRYTDDGVILEMSLKEAFVLFDLSHRVGGDPWKSWRAAADSLREALGAACPHFERLRGELGVEMRKTAGTIMYPTDRGRFYDEGES